MTERLRLQRRVAESLKQFEDPEAVVSVAPSRLALALKIGSPTLSREIIRSGQFNFKEDPNKPSNYLISTVQFKQVEQAIVEMRTKKKL